jgi:hypothetical protein
MQDHPIKKGEKWVNRFSGQKVTISQHIEGKSVDYIKDNPTMIPELNIIISSFTKPEHIFLRQYEKL